MGRTGIDLRGGTDLAELAEVHHGDAVAHVADDREVVGDEQHRQPVAPLHRLEEIEDLGLHRHVEGGHGLVAQQERRIEYEGAGDADALRLATREGARAAIAVLVDVETDCIEHLAHLDGDLGAGSAPGAEGRADDVAHSTAGVERRDRVLQDHLQLGPDAPQLTVAHAHQLTSFELNGS